MSTFRPVRRLKSLVNRGLDEITAIIAGILGSKGSLTRARDVRATFIGWTAVEAAKYKRSPVVRISPDQIAHLTEIFCREPHVPVLPEETVKLLLEPKWGHGSTLRLIRTRCGEQWNRITRRFRRTRS